MTALEASHFPEVKERGLSPRTWLSEDPLPAGTGELKTLVFVGKLSTAMSLTQPPHCVAWPPPETAGTTTKATKQMEPR